MDLSAGIIGGDRRALARAMTLVENGALEGRNLLESLRPQIGRARRWGVTGPPGVGKSTLLSALIHAARAHGLTVGVLAVDPSSPYTAGAFLGDRVRMSEHTLDAGVFIRSQASRGALGGLAPTTADLLDLLDAAGFDLVLVETVGVGQSELDVARTADTTVVVLSAGSGDLVQAMKAGLIEAGDTFVINKADLPGAENLRDDLLAAFEMTPRGVGAADRVLLASGLHGTGVDVLLNRLLAVPAADIAARRDAGRARRLDGGVARLLEDCLRAPATAAARTQVLTALAAGTITVEAAVRCVFDAALAARAPGARTP